MVELQGTLPPHLLNAHPALAWLMQDTVTTPSIKEKLGTLLLCRIRNRHISSRDSLSSRFVVTLDYLINNPS